jgi:hypothetical protein
MNLVCDAAEEAVDPHQAVVHCSNRNLRLQTRLSGNIWRRNTMDGIIYLVGLIVIILAILSFFGLR